MAPGWVTKKKHGARPRPPRLPGPKANYDLGYNMVLSEESCHAWRNIDNSEPAYWVLEGLLELDRCVRDPCNINNGDFCQDVDHTYYDVIKRRGHVLLIEDTDGDQFCVGLVRNRVA